MSVPKGKRPSKEENIKFWASALGYIAKKEYKLALKETKKVDEYSLTVQEKKNFFQIYLYCIILLDRGQMFCTVMNIGSRSYLQDDAKLCLEIISFAENKGIHCPLLKCKFLIALGGEKMDEAFDILQGLLEDPDPEWVICASFKLGQIYRARGMFIEERAEYIKTKNAIHHILSLEPETETFFVTQCERKIEEASSMIVEKETTKNFSRW